MTILCWIMKMKICISIDQLNNILTWSWINICDLWNYFKWEKCCLCYIINKICCLITENLFDENKTNKNNKLTKISLSITLIGISFCFVSSDLLLFYYIYDLVFLEFAIFIVDFTLFITFAVDHMSRYDFKWELQVNSNLFSK